MNSPTTAILTTSALRRIFSILLLHTVTPCSVNAQTTDATSVTDPAAAPKSAGFPARGPSLTAPPAACPDFVKARWMDRDGDGWDDLWCHMSRLTPDAKNPDKLAGYQGRDTDGDGVSDYDEMLRWRDPNVKGPPLNWPNLTPEQVADAKRKDDAHRAKLQAEWEANLAAKGDEVRPQFGPGELAAPEERFKVDNEFAALRAKAAASRLVFEAKERALNDASQRMGAPREVDVGGGKKLQLSGGSGGEPLYIGGNNYFAASSISADEVWPSAVYFGRDFTTGYNLTGNGQTLGIWEVNGGVLTSHLEFGSRVIQKDSSSLDTSGHATQVAGTMAGAGAITLFGPSNTALSRGVAYQANVFANNTPNFKAERESQAAGNANDPPLLASNHSWGSVAGWEKEDIDPTAGVNLQWVWRGSTAAGVQEDWRLSTYSGHQDDDTGSVDLDTFMAADAPRHLTIYACGNDRSNGPGSAPSSGTYYVPAFGGGYTTMSTTAFPRDWSDGDDGGYDSLDAPGTAKNVLTVGACEDVYRIVSGTYRFGYDTGANVVAAAFSGFGPTDDGRVKPDLVATGIGSSSFRTWLFGTAYDVITSSAAATNDYVNAAGTSISAPGVTGGMALMLQHRKNLYPALTNADAWRGSTLKAIAIEACDDVGAPGPEFDKGFGIYNVKKCCDLVSADKAQGRNSLIKEPSLAVGASVSWLVYAAGGQTVSGTAAWSDPAGTAPAGGTIDPTTPMLVNNINLKIEYLGPVASVPDFPASSYPAQETYHPWTLNPDLAGKSAAARSAPAVQAVDSLNNVEKVSIVSAAAGVYRVTLKHESGVGAQAVSVAMSGVTLRAGRCTSVVKAPATNDYTLTFETDPDAYFTLQSSTDMLTWTDVSAVHSSASGAINTIVATAGGADTRRFWRLKRG